MGALSQLINDALDGTESVRADVAFEDDYSLEPGDLQFSVMHRGQALTPGHSPLR